MEDNDGRSYFNLSAVCKKELKEKEEGLFLPF
jgi:hypothetical protein